MGYSEVITGAAEFPGQVGIGRGHPKINTGKLKKGYPLNLPSREWTVVGNSVKLQSLNTPGHPSES